MTNSSDQSDIDRQYLKAMNIDLWVEQDFTEATGAVPVQSEPPAVTTAANTAKLLAGMTATELKASIGELSFSTIQQGSNNELLVVTEEMDLSAECNNLLGSMFSAIKLDASQWVHTSIAQVDVSRADVSGATSTQTLKALSDSVPLKAVVFMLRTGGRVDGLQQLRGQQLRVGGVKPFVVVTFHPQDLIENPDTKRPAWEDLKQLRQWLGQ